MEMFGGLVKERQLLAGKRDGSDIFLTFSHVDPRNTIARQWWSMIFVAATMPQVENWNDQAELLIGIIFLISSMLSMIFVAIIGYYVTWCVYKIFGIAKEETSYATDEKREKNQGSDGEDLWLSEES